jgi:hypothetical protein
MNLRERISTHLDGKRILWLLLITNVVYFTMVLFTGPLVSSYSNGMKILDLKFGYDAGYVNALFTTLGETGRHVYLYNQLPVDMVYPLLAGLTYCLVIGYLLRKLEKFEGPLFYLCLTPLLSGLFDYIENIGIISLLVSYPNPLEKLTVIFSGATVIKFIFGGINFLAIIILLVAWGISGALASRK